MVTTHTDPTYLQPSGKEQRVAIVLYNVGAAASSGPITVTDTLPPGLTATEAGFFTRVKKAGFVKLLQAWNCSITGPVVTCTASPENLPSVQPGGFIRLDIEVEVAPNHPASGENKVIVAGGGTLETAGSSNPVVFSSASPQFGFTQFDAWASNADGTPDTQAGSHPYEETVNLTLNNAQVISTKNVGELTGINVGGNARDINVSLPPGLVGDPTAVPQCTNQQFNENNCPVASQVGVIRATLGIWQGKEEPFIEAGFRLYNLVPPPGEPAQFGFDFKGIHVFLNAGVRSGNDYAITEHSGNIPAFVEVSVNVWGTPGDPSHDQYRCFEFNNPPHEPGGPSKCTGPYTPMPQIPFLTLPTSCEGPKAYTAEAVSWTPRTPPGRIGLLSHDSNGVPTGFTGCDHLGFGPSISAAPDTSFADTPAGLSVDVRVPQEALLVPEGLITSNIKNTTVTLPEGFVINPGQAAGLAACGPAEDGLTTEAERAEGREDNGPPSCPNASKVGTDEIETPLLSKPLQGNVYVLKGDPPELKLLVAASGEGVNLKLVGTVHLDEQTGRLTTTFAETPGLPFTNFKLSFSGGAQAALDTPTQCGTYTTTSDFAPWSTPFVGDVFPTSSFAVEHGPSGTACPPAPLPFSPSLIAGATTDQAGGFTNFSLLLQNGDGQQRIEKLQFQAPPGLSAMLSQVALCQEPQAAAGTCSVASHIGHAVVASGPGPYPLLLPQPGAPELPIYLTGPYKGAPFGLAIVTPVIAGPFNLGTIVTRAKIEVDATTAQITVTTDPLPQIVKGVPTDLRLINSVIDRPNFMFNPTNCNPNSFSGTAWGAPPPGTLPGGTQSSGPGATAPIASHFQVGSCRGLEFQPKFSVSTAARTSKALGASLTAKVAYPNVPQGAQANIAKVKVDLPIQLPSRLTTLQKACLDKVFNANPAACPPQSIIGQAKVITPLLPVPLTGPAYFVSHGGEAFPSLTMVLQGYGVTVDLVGTTFINRKGITSTTFKTVPDTPFNTFELTLPQGRFSALGANLPAKAKGSFCGQNLKMPTLFVAQNGLELHQNTPINVTGCPKPKKAKKKHAHRATHDGKRAGHRARRKN
jgi:hypothetical protein